MSGRSTKSKQAGKRTTVSEKSGLTYPVTKISRFLKNRNVAPRINKEASIFFTAAVQYMAEEVMDISKQVAFKRDRKRIIPRHIMLALHNEAGDSELKRLFSGVYIAQGGVVPSSIPRKMDIEREKKAAKKAKKEAKKKKAAKLAKQQQMEEKEESDNEEEEEEEEDEEDEEEESEE